MPRPSKTQGPFEVLAPTVEEEPVIRPPVRERPASVRIGGQVLHESLLDQLFESQGIGTKVRRVSLDRHEDNHSYFERLDRPPRRSAPA